MDIRVLHYFLAVARHESISRAAEELHISQPALSRQLMDLEEELGAKLLLRGKKYTTLTEAGNFLKRRAEEITALAQKTLDEFAAADEMLGGDIRIGCCETDGIRILARSMRDICAKHPLIRYHLYTMDDGAVKDGLDKGLLDFGILTQPHTPKKYRYIELKHEDSWGVLMKNDSPLAEKRSISPEDLWDKPLIISQQALFGNELRHWFTLKGAGGKDEDELSVVATYTFINNAAILVEEGLGYALTLDRLVRTNDDNALVFRPLSPRFINRLFFIWNSRQVFSRAAAKLLEKISAYSFGEMPD